MLTFKLNPFFYPPEVGADAPIEDKALSKEETIELLAEDGEEQETLELEKPGKKAAKEDDKEDKEGSEEEKEPTLEEELEEELEEPDEDKLELSVSLKKKEILAKYPSIFKDFPQLEAAYYRERAYTELLPTINDAKMAVEKSERLDMYESDIMSGSTETLLSAVLATDKNAFAKVIDNYLPTLYKVDEGAYYHTIGNVIKNTIMSMVRDGKANDTDELIQAADIVNQYIFGTKQFTPPQRLSREDVEESKKNNEIDEREVKFTERQFNIAKDAVTVKTDNTIKGTIDKYIDPNESMTDYVKKNASREAFELVENAIAADTRFGTVLDKLWEKAFEDDFSAESMGKIHSAYLSKAKTLLPAIIKKCRNEALRGLGKRVREDDEEQKPRDKRGPLPVGKARGSSGPQSTGKTDRDKAKSIPRGTTTLQYLMQD